MKKYLPHLVSVVVIFLTSVFYFLPQFQGKVVPMGDIIQYNGMSHELSEHYAKTGENALWTNAMFGGMPAYQIWVKDKSNLIQHVDTLFNLGLSRPAGYFIAGMLSFFLMMILLGVNPWLSLVGALLFGFSTNNLILFEAGHTSKLRAILYSPLIIAGVVMVFRKQWLLGGSIFAVGMGLNLKANHPQMTYYLGMVMAIYVLIHGVNTLRNGKGADLVKSLGVLGIGLILALGSSASVLLPTYEYSKDTMRGKPILVNENPDPASSSAVEGLAWDYAMSWSNGFKDVMASFIPRAVGGGSVEPVAKDSNFGKAIRATKEVQAPLYWGALPFTSGPAYLGALALFLFLFSAFIVKSDIKWWIVGGVILTIMISLGKNLEFFNRLLFDYFPYFNKFRTPNSVLSITAVLIPFLAVLGLSEFIQAKDKSSFWKPAWQSAAVMAGLAILYALFGSMTFDFSSPSDARYEQFMDVLKQDRASYLWKSSLRSALIIGIGLAIFYAYIKSKISTVTFAVLLALTGLFDLVGVGHRYFSSEDFVSSRSYENNFTPRSVDVKIMQDTDPHYRVFDVSTDPFNSASASYFHKTIGGYHAAKLQRYQDMIDRHISQNNMAVLNMLNTKYFIIQGSNGELTYQLNPAAMGNAWFVSEISMVNSANAEIDSLSQFNPAVTAFVHNEFEGYINGRTAFNKSGTITLTSYQPDVLKYRSDSDSEQMAVFSEVYYGPNKGWQAYVDGQAVEHVRVNYILRGLILPPGQHNIEFRFEPSTYAAGTKVSFISSLLILILVVLAGFLQYKKQNSLA